MKLLKIDDDVILLEQEYIRLQQEFPDRHSYMSFMFDLRRFADANNIDRVAYSIFDERYRGW